MPLRILTLFFFLVSFYAPAEAAKTHVAVAANFTAPAVVIAKAFQEETGHEAILSFGSTGKLYAQIINGAPFSVFLAADQERPLRLEQERQGVSDSRFTYAIGKIALFSPFPNFFEQAPLATLSLDKVRRIAIANPKTAPYGQEAQNFLEKHKLLDSVQHKLVMGENIAQTYQFVMTKNAQVGFVALSQIINEPKGSYWPLPESDYKPIIQQAILLKKGQEDIAARSFITFLKGPRAEAIIRSFGYDLP